MNKIPLTVAALCAATILSACKANEAIDATIGMQNQMSSMLATTKEMKAETSKLNEAIHLQKLDAAIKTMFAPENTKEYFPPSSGLLAGAKVFAEEATASEIVEYFYVTLKEVDKTTPKESMRQADGTFPANYLEQFNQEKFVKLTALQAIAAQTPYDVIENIIDSEMFNGGGRYEETAYAFLMLRAMFIQGYYLDEGVLSLNIDNLGKLKKAYEYINYLEFIAEQPFADKVRLKTVGFVQPVENIDITFDSSIMKSYWKKLLKAIDNELPEKYKNSTSPYSRTVLEIKEKAEKNLSRWN